MSQPVPVGPKLCADLTSKTAGIALSGGANRKARFRGLSKHVRRLLAYLPGFILSPFEGGVEGGVVGGVPVVEGAPPVSPAVDAAAPVVAPASPVVDPAAEPVVEPAVEAELPVEPAVLPSSLFPQPTINAARIPAASKAITFFNFNLLS